LNIAEEIKKLKSLKDKAEGQIELLEAQHKNLILKYKRLNEQSEAKYGCEIEELEKTLQTDENKLIALVNDANLKYKKLTETNE